jgi:hypothetical protein
VIRMETENVYINLTAKSLERPRLGWKSDINKSLIKEAVCMDGRWTLLTQIRV